MRCPRCACLRSADFFAPEKTPAIGGGSLRDRVAVADLVEMNYALKDKEIYEVAVALAQEDLG